MFAWCSLLNTPIISWKVRYGLRAREEEAEDLGGDCRPLGAGVVEVRPQVEPSVGSAKGCRPPVSPSGSAGVLGPIFPEDRSGAERGWAVPAAAAPRGRVQVS